MAAGAHNILLQAEYILTSTPPSVPWPEESREGDSVKSNQPNDAQQGIQQVNILTLLNFGCSLWCALALVDYLFVETHKVFGNFPTPLA